MPWKFRIREGLTLSILLTAGAAAADLRFAT